MVACEQQPRTVRVELLSATGVSSRDVAVKTHAGTFGELIVRLLAANVPGVTEYSFIDIYTEEAGYVCLLDEDELPNNMGHPLQVRVHAASQQSEAAGAYGPVPASSRAIRKEQKLLQRLERQEAKHQGRMARLQAKLERHAARFVDKAAHGRQSGCGSRFGCNSLRILSAPAADPAGAGALAEPVAMGVPVHKADGLAGGLKGLRLRE